MNSRMAKVIWLHGASSSGKSTIARSLQQRIDEPFWHYSIDHLRDSGVLPLERVGRGEFAWSDLRMPFFDGFHRSVGAFLAAGNNLILEHIIEADSAASFRKQLAELLRPYDVFFVGVRCSLEELVRRERDRGNRPLGSAEADYHRVHNGLRYDLELDAEADPGENVDRLLSSWSGRTGTSLLFSAAVS
jgi:chloramphenicol 3-O phosphotransferase